MNQVIEVKNLAKQYKLIHLERGFVTLRDKINSAFVHPIKLLKNLKNSQQESFWALQDINFSVKQGEIVGIIGGNGAGKSTLLKVLSRITPPTKGQVKITGRIASLLEVGTGFHPELTGRENIFLNGAILGMPKADIVKRFDEIVEFAGVEKFLDTPVKRYSSGMYVRLAFAVAAHMDADILFVDEVLAVGDAEFQKKCLGKIGGLVKEGHKTILFVSHNLSTIRSLCHRTILLSNGHVVADGLTSEVIERYLSGQTGDLVCQAAWPEDLSQPINVRQIQLSNEVGQITNLFNCDQEILVDFICQINEPNIDFSGYLAVKDASGNIVLESISDDNIPDQISGLKPGQHTFRLAIPARSLAPGRYGLCLSFLFNGRSEVGEIAPLCEFELVDKKTNRGNDRNGFFSTILKWHRLKD